MRLIDKGKLLSVLNDNWLATAPMDNNSEEVKAERNAMCRGLDVAMGIVQEFPEIAVGGWTSVKDRLPEMHTIPDEECEYKVSEEVLILKEGDITIGYLEDDGDGQSWVKSSDGCLLSINAVTHWAKFPELP